MGLGEEKGRIFRNILAETLGRLGKGVLLGMPTPLPLHPPPLASPAPL